MKILLSSQYHPSKVNRVIFTTRDTTSAKAKELIDLGAEAVQSSGADITVENLKGVDVVVNVLARQVDHEAGKTIAKKAVEAGVKVYFPSGYSWCVFLFSASCQSILMSLFFHSDFTRSKISLPHFRARIEGAEHARKVGDGRLKVILLYPGAFMEWWISVCRSGPSGATKLTHLPTAFPRI